MTIEQAVDLLIESVVSSFEVEDELLYDQPQPFVVKERFANSVMNKSFFFRINAIYTTEFVDLHPNWGVFLMTDYVIVEIPADKFMEAFADYQIVVGELEAKGLSYSALASEQKMTHLLGNKTDEQIVRDEPQHDRKDQIAHQPIQGPREIGIPMSENLKYIYTWVDGREVRTLRKQYQ